MKLSEHKNFINSKENYIAAKYFWQDFFLSINDNFSEYIINEYKNEIEIMDGNPIFSALYKEYSKAIRIIQNPIIIQEPIFVSWLNKIDLNGIELIELVIMVQPNNYLMNDIVNLVKSFISPRFRIRYINKLLNNLNEKYQTKWDIIRSRKIIRKLDELMVIDLSNIEKLQSLEINKNVLKDFGQFVSIENNFINVPTQLTKSPISEALEKVGTKVRLITDVVTVKGDYRFIKTPSVEGYKRKVKKGYKNTENFKRSIKSNLFKFNKELNDLKTKLQ